MIDSYSFGKIVIDGKIYTSDVIIFPDRVKGNWWRKKGHSLCLDDITEIIECAPDVIIFGKGSSGRMEIPGTVKDYIEGKNIEIFADNTEKACQYYNSISKTRRAVAALHLTC